MLVFFSSQINALKHLKIRDRQAVIAISLSMLSPVNKVLLRIIKLLLLSPLFLIFAVFEGWLLIPFLLTTPIEINFAKKHLCEALTQYTKGA